MPLIRYWVGFRSASPGNNQVWKTDGSGAPGWRTDATGGGSGSPVAVANPQALTPGTSTLRVGGATLGTEMPDNVSVQIPITSLGTGDLASGLSSNNFTLKAGAYLIFVHMDEIWNTTSSSNALQYRSTVASGDYRYASGWHGSRSDASLLQRGYTELIRLKRPLKPMFIYRLIRRSG